MMDEVGREIEESIKRIYNDCWFIYKEYLGSHDMAQYERRTCELKRRYPGEEFLTDILQGFKKELIVLRVRCEKGEEIEERIKSIYNDCWFIYKEYLGNHDLAKYNRRVCELKEKYPNKEFLKDILYGFIKKLNTLQARYLMARDGRIRY